jgi:hypothetical protein
MASAIPSGCARDARQVGRRTWRPRFFLWSSTLRRSCRLRRSLGGPGLDACDPQRSSARWTSRGAPAVSCRRAWRGGLYKMSGTRRSGRALRRRRGAGDQGQPVPRRDRRGARSMAQRERLHDDSRRAHRAIASGASAHVFSAHAFDKALSQRHGSGSRRPRRLVPPVRD